MGVASQAGQAFFKFIKPRRSPALLRRNLRDLDTGYYQLPANYSILSRFAAEELKLHHDKPLQLKQPEQHLTQEFLAAFPQAQLEAVDLRSFKPSIARQFAARQLQLMRGKGVMKHTAFNTCKAEMLEELQGLNRQQQLGAGANLQLLQSEEEKQLRAALEVVAKRGPPRITR